MAHVEKPIATPKHKAVKGSVIAREPSGRFIDVVDKGRSNGRNEKYVVARVTGVTSGSRAEMRLNVMKGFDFSAIAQLEAEFGASQKEIAQALSIPLSTLTRRKKEGFLHPDESDRVLRFATLKEAALTLMCGDERAAIDWLRTPLDIFGGESPLEYASTELGARDVEDLIGRLRYGVFS